MENLNNPIFGQYLISCSINLLPISNNDGLDILLRKVNFQSCNKIEFIKSQNTRFYIPMLP